MALLTRYRLAVLLPVCIALTVASCVRVAVNRAPRTAGEVPGCFETAGLSEARKTLVQGLLLRAMDSEALYTIAAPIKPTSSGFADLRLRVRPTLDAGMIDSVAEYNAILPSLSCGNVLAELSIYGAAFPEGRDTTVRVRYISLTMINRAALARTIQQHAPFFASLAVVPGSSPLSVLGAVEYADRSPRWRGYGYLFGYPDDAVEFFVRSGEKGDSIDALNKAAGRAGSYVEPRDFRLIETFHKTSECAGCPATRPSFVYAVSKGAPVSAGDRALQQATAPVYAEYVRRRAAASRDGRVDVVRLLREWNAEQWRAGTSR